MQRSAPGRTTDTTPERSLGTRPAILSAAWQRAGALAVPRSGRLAGAVRRRASLQFLSRTPDTCSSRPFCWRSPSLALYALHQDVWFWRAAHPLAFGFLPVGLAYHGAYCLASALLMWIADEGRLAGATSRIREDAGVDPRDPRLRLPGGRPLHRHLRVPASPGRRDHEAEDYFLAGRALGPVVFLLSLFGTNMTAFTILGSAGHAFANGIVTFGLMASSSAFVIPLTLVLRRHAHVGARAAGTAS